MGLSELAAQAAAEWDIVYVSRGIGAWMCVIVMTMAACALQHQLFDPAFYKAGPHADFKVLGLAIDTYGRYSLLVVYCVVNSAVRAVHHNVLAPGLTNQVQDTSRTVSARARRAEMRGRDERDGGGQPLRRPLLLADR